MADLSMPTQWGSSKCQHERLVYLEGSETPEMHTVDVWTPNESSTEKIKKVWIIFIHGGAWRTGDLTQFIPTLHNLLKSNSLKHIAGFASINYRLSPYPRLPDTASDPNHNVQHPEHLSDTLSALAFLNNRYQFDNEYLLMGHSCGASLVFQVDQRSAYGAAGWSIPQPVGILGVEGIYDFPALVNYHKGETAVYEEFITGAFGSDRESWRLASPTSLVGNRAWMAAKVVAIAHSDEDELVEMEQPRLMQEILEKVPSDERRGLSTLWSEEKRQVVFIETKGKHDETWQKGTMDHAIEQVLGLLLN